MISYLTTHCAAGLGQLASIHLPGSQQRLFDLWLPFGSLGVISWSVWLGRRALTACYRPVANSYRAPASVVAPCFREDPDVLATAVGTWLAAGAREIVLVFPADEPLNVRRAADAFSAEPRVRMSTSVESDKRHMLDVGIRAAVHDLVVLSDSDTIWSPELLTNLLMPFVDERVGGVGTRQKVIDPTTSIWRRAADWMLDAKYLTYVPAMARKGGVSCLSGRTVAYRRQILLDVLPELTGETFFGRKCISGDDGRLTWLVLNEGYRTAYQVNAVAWTMMPDNAAAFFKQRLRWSRNSYRCYLRAIYRGWLFRQPMITRLSVIQGLLAPLSLTVGFVFVGETAWRGDWLAVAIWGCWITTGRGLRAFDHLREQPRHIVLLPMMTVIILFVMTALKYYTFFTMNRQAWITRREDRGVAEGQAASTLRGTTFPRRPVPADLVLAEATLLAPAAAGSGLPAPTFAPGAPRRRFRFVPTTGRGEHLSTPNQDPIEARRSS